MTDEGADFAPQRLGGGRRVPSLLAWVVVLGAFVTVGVAGRAGAEDNGPPSGSDGPRGQVPAIDREATPGASPGAPATARPIARNPRASSDSGPIQMELVRTSASIFVHADIHARHVAWVFVQVQTVSGRVAGWASMSFPGSVDPPAEATDGRDLPALRFDVELVIPEDMRSGQLWTQVNVYDNLGQRVATSRLEAPGADAAVELERTLQRGFRPTGPPWNREMADES